MAVIVDIITIIGVGLIGSSLARGLRAKGAVKKIIICDSNDQTLARAKTLGLGDQYVGEVSEAVGDADMIILATPIGQMSPVCQAMAPHLKAGAIVSDVGSVKEKVVADLTPILPSNVHLVPSHPVAGTEQSGPDAGFADLFHDRWTILTPSRETNVDAVETVQRLWEALGSTVERMDANHHDLVLAITSHVPHLIAYNIVGTASDLEKVTKSEVIKYSAGGFRDFTRIAASDPTMWRDVFLNNKAAVLEMLGRFSEDLTQLQRAIRWEDGDALHALFSRTRKIRRDIIDAGQEEDTINFNRSSEQGDDA